jgi:hypothetical protein
MGKGGLAERVPRGTGRPVGLGVEEGSVERGFGLISVTVSGKVVPLPAVNGADCIVKKSIVGIQIPSILSLRPIFRPSSFGRKKRSERCLEASRTIDDERPG